ncbi:MAG: hypothetical protein L0196_05010 [candidate division Zixibacteria bacterium]|nr:hypothetical protein [candidate division Zixibacteria bacterium]
MFKKNVSYGLIFLALSGLHSGCSSTKEFTRRPEPKTVPASPLSVLTKDGGLYRVKNYRFADSLFWAAGALEKDGKIRPFEGRLALGDIDYVQAKNNWGAGKILLATGAAVIFSAVAISYLNKGSDGFSVQEVHGTYYPPSSGGGDGWYSCPFIYSYDGGQYHLESETFAGAVFKGAERASFDKLERLRPVKGQYRLKLANESEETEYVNEIKLLVVDAPPGVKVIPDAKGSLHTLSRPVYPFRCVDGENKDVLSAVREKDDRWWESELAAKDLSRDEKLRDGLVLEFEKPREAKAAKLVVSGVNTALGIFAFEQLFQLKGENQLRWYQKLEGDPAERGKLIAWMRREGMLHVKVWKEGEWVEQTALPDVGPGISKDQVAVLDLSQIPSGTVKLKLESATDLWRINQVYLDYSPDLPVEVAEIEPAGAVDERGNDVASSLRRNDDRYYVTIKGQYAHLTFEEVPARAGRQRHYAVKAKGYYHQWFEAEGAEETALLERVLTEPLFGSRTFMPLWKARKGQ